MGKSVTCPTCGKSVAWTPESRWRPFCSERCRLIDLGAWLGEEHRIAGPSDEGLAWPLPDQDPEAPSH
jgi:uncharacterized protein